MRLHDRWIDGRLLGAEVSVILHPYFVHAFLSIPGIDSVWGVILHIFSLHLLVRRDLSVCQSVGPKPFRRVAMRCRFTSSMSYSTLLMPASKKAVSGAPAEEVRSTTSLLPSFVGSGGTAKSADHGISDVPSWR